MNFLTELLSDSSTKNSTGSGSGTENVNQSSSNALQPLLDSAATHHITKSLCGMENVQATRNQLKLADSTVTGVTHIDTKKLKPTGKNISLSDFLCAPPTYHDLVSVPMLARDHSVLFCKDRAYVIPLVTSRPANTVGTVTLIEG